MESNRIIKLDSTSKFCLFFACIILIIVSLGCSGQNNEKRAQGYIEGRYTYIATSVAGVLKQMYVRRGALVKKGQPLFALDPQPQSDEYEAALENLKQAKHAREAIAANLTYAKLTYERYLILLPKKAIDKAALDNAKAIYNVSIAQLAQADATIASSEAAVSKAKWSIEQKIVHAPLAAFVFDTYYRLGEFTAENTPILSLLAPSDIKAIFYVNEPVLGHIHLQDIVDVICDGCRTSYNAKITYISPVAEYTPPVIFSEQTNYKLVYRIEAEFNPSDAFNMHPGQPISVKYKIHG